MIGQTISHYTIVEKLGEGGMGVVYMAHDVKLDRTVALKFLPHHLTVAPEEQGRFDQEARAAAALNHPHICTIHDIADVEGQRFIVMEYVDGQTLRSHLPVRRMQDAITYAVQIGEALAEAHSHGIVHRDIKPENIMINAKHQIKIMDFGLAKLKGSLKLTKTSSTVGTLAYMAPEQIQGGEIDARSDIFSFGVVLYEMLTGHTPFRGDHEAAMMYSILNEEAESLQNLVPDVSPELVHILNRALEKDPEERYQSVSEMVIDLRRLKKETSRVTRTIPSGVLTSGRRPHQFSFSNTTILTRGALTILVVLITVVLVMLILPADRPSGKIPVAVMTFQNQTGEAQYDYLRSAIPNLLITSLEQSQFLQVMTWERMRDLLRQMGKEQVSEIDSDLGFEICARDSIRAIVVGSFVKAGDMFATDVKVIDVQTKELLRSAGSRGEGVASILKIQIDELSRQISEGIGLPEQVVRAEHRPVADVTTSNMSAYEQYVKGKEAYDNWDYEQARKHLEHAVAIDTSFAYAYRYLASALGYLGFREARDEAYRKAFEHSDKATELERLYILERYAWIVELDRPKAVSILEEIAEKYPKDQNIHLRLGIYHYNQGEYDKSIASLNNAIALDSTSAEAFNQLGYAYGQKGDYEKALKFLSRYMALLPNSANPHDSKGEIYVAMGWYERALEAYDRAITMNPTFFDSYYRASYVLALQEDYEGAKRYIDRAYENNTPPALRASCRMWMALYAYWAGRTRETLGHLAEAERLYIEAQNPFYEAFYHWWRSTLYSEQGKVRLSSEHYTYFSRMVTVMVPDVPIWHKYHTTFADGFAILRSGNLAEARKYLDTLGLLLQRVEKNQRWIAEHFYETFTAEIFLREGRPEECIIALQNQDPVLLIGSFGTFARTFLNVYLREDQRARAYAMKGDNASAIREYEAIISRDPARDNHLLIHPLYHYHLARLYEQAGELGKAVAQYKRFLVLWGKADSDHPEPKEARERLMSLTKEKTP